MKNIYKLLALGVVTAVAACAVPATDTDGLAQGESPAVEDDTLDEKQTIYWGGNAYTATAYAPSSAITNSIRAKAYFAGPAPAPMGVCILQLTTTPCSGLDNVNTTDGYEGPCTAHAIGTGGWRYCTAPNNTGPKYCAIRTGTQSAHCEGTPKTGALVDPNALPSGIMTTANIGIPLAPTKWLSYACFAGCKGLNNEPSVSSASTSTGSCKAYNPPSCPNADYCNDFGCDGDVEYTQCYSGGRLIRCM